MERLFPLGDDDSPPHAVDFDSATTFVKALASHLRGETFDGLGVVPRPLRPLLPHLNRLPPRLREGLYARAGTLETRRPSSLGDVDVEEIRRWVVDRYPRREYPAVFVGAADGAGCFLAALLGVPWLPQTFLVPVRRRAPPDGSGEDLERSRRWGRSLLASNPNVELAQMYDPNQDRLMVGRVGYFRTKSLRLGPAYERFIADVLPPEGRVVLVDCELRWPVTRVGDRHTFQFGGVGGLSPTEYRAGGPDVRSFLAGRGSPRRSWDPPPADEEAPEAEWGFHPGLRTDANRFARESGLRVDRLAFDHPADLSPVVADLYRSHYRERGDPAGRLVAHSFALVDPRRTLRTRSVPFWTVFNAADDVERLERYLDGVEEPYSAVYLQPFSNGVEAAGFADADRWLASLDGVERGGFLGVDPSAYPRDFGAYSRYGPALAEAFDERDPPPPAPVERAREFVRSRGDGVSWTTDYSP